ncbi:MAG: hypothetical protein LBB78_04780, partial [Spirochaetaceae bacterium]|nr:hypothetical protein [Spirochaetaceae bacterium]
MLVRGVGIRDIGAILEISSTTVLGKSPEAVIKSIGYQRRMIYYWLAQYRFGGFEALQVHKSSGRPPK